MARCCTNRHCREIRAEIAKLVSRAERIRKQIYTRKAFLRKMGHVVGPIPAAVHLAEGAEGIRCMVRRGTRVQRTKNVADVTCGRCLYYIAQGRA